MCDFDGHIHDVHNIGCKVVMCARNHVVVPAVSVKVAGK